MIYRLVQPDGSRALQRSLEILILVPLLRNTQGSTFGSGISTLCSYRQLSFKNCNSHGHDSLPYNFSDRNSVSDLSLTLAFRPPVRYQGAPSGNTLPLLMVKLSTDPRPSHTL